MLFLFYIAILTFSLFISVFNSKLRITDLQEELLPVVNQEKITTDFFSEKRQGHKFPHLSQEL
jgi:hypothetical protein